MIDITLPIRTVNESNGQHGHWGPKSKRRKAQRKAANEWCWWAFNNQKPHPSLPVVVTMSRVSAGTLDDDNLRVSLKSIRDGIADAFGVPDNDPRIEWRYAQQKGKRGEHAVRITIETRA